MDKCKPDRQTILFSATLDDDVKKIVDNYQTDPVQIGIGPEEVSMDSMSHFFWNVNSRKKPKLCSRITDKCGRSIIFCRTRAGVNRLGDDLKEIGSSFATLHGGMNQKQRDKAMKKFSSGRSRILIATDVASRGIDVTDVSCVIHFDPPDDGKVYKHRSGRTARAGSTGTVVCLVLKSQIRKYKRIQNEVGIKCRFVDPNLDRLEGREFIEAPPLKFDDEKKPRGRRNSRNNKRSRRYKKSDGYKSQKSDDKKLGGRDKKKSYRHRNKRKSKKKVTYKDKRNNKAKFNRR